MKNFLESKNVRAVIFILGGIAAALLVFSAGVAVGERKAIFSAAWGKNYGRFFFTAGPPPGAIGVMVQRGPWNTHGVAGQVIDVSSSSFMVKDPDNDERSIAITSGTVIRDANQVIPLDNIDPGYQVVVIGQPNASGQVEARFVRVFEVSSSPQ
ncbi:MAG: hypothetical protein KGJ13_01405 [Patescibacteria group bacterium]|nr:hypothetical protein [Patescibacteria group bacterium]